MPSAAAKAKKVPPRPRQALLLSASAQAAGGADGKVTMSALESALNAPSVDDLAGTPRALAACARSAAAPAHTDLAPSKPGKAGISAAGLQAAAGGAGARRPGATASALRPGAKGTVSAAGLAAAAGVKAPALKKPPVRGDAKEIDFDTDDEADGGGVTEAALRKAAGAPPARSARPQSAVKRASPMRGRSAERPVGTCPAGILARIAPSLPWCRSRAPQRPQRGREALRRRRRPWSPA